MYVPFWLFSCDSTAHIRYKGIRNRLYSDSDYNYVESSYYNVIRGGEVNFKNIPADGSHKLDDLAMESIEPFFYEGLKEFQTAYLAGYIADKYDVDVPTVLPRINKRIENTIVEIFEPTEYSSCHTENVSIQLTKDQASYTLLPVWILNTKYNDTLYTFYMNGQTGKFSGKLPISLPKASLFFFGIFITIVSIAAFIVYLVL